MKLMSVVLVVMVLLMGDANMSLAQEPIAQIESTYLQKMIEQRETGVLVIDVRSTGDYRKGHIKGAINIPEAILEEDESLPHADKAAQIVFYCSGSA